MNIGLWLIVIVGGAVGILSTLYCVISLVAVLAYKIYRKVVHKIPLLRAVSFLICCLPYI